MATRVLITREQAEPLAHLLAARGLESAHLPLVSLVATSQLPPCPQPAQVLVTSASALRFAPALVDWVGSARVVVVGSKTAAAAEQAGLRGLLVGTSGGQSALDLLDPELEPTVFVGAMCPAPAVSRALCAGHLLHWAVYQQAPPEPPDKGGALPRADIVTLASPSAARAWARLDRDGVVPVVVIGETTANAARAAGLHVVGQAEKPDLDALAAAAAAAAAVHTWPRPRQHR
ncbi:MAG: uroporphyrinogen-III synthase [Oligoflexia bacterium]|nr:uroporphyrinogen-III synthase [Oligoflexia bacterium]